jgi:hypothetical protein
MAHSAKMKPWVKFISFFFGAFFLVFAIFQYNDEDGVLWMGIYGIAMAISVGVAFNRVIMPILVAAAMAYLVGSIAQWPPQFEGFGDTMDNLNVELARESAGLLSCFLVMLFYIYWVYQVRFKKQ